MPDRTDADETHAQLVLMRHGESTSNAARTFTGWRDVDLTPRGREQATAAGRLLRARGLAVTAVFTSVLRRAIETADNVLAELGVGSSAGPASAGTGVPRATDWRLNERHYGAMQGMRKDEVEANYGSESVRAWRRAWNAAPPPVAAGGEDDPRIEPRYAAVRDEVPLTESIEAMAQRTLAVWEQRIRPLLLGGGVVLVVGHGLSLRGLARPVEGVLGPELPRWKLPSAAPRWYRLDRSMNVRSVAAFGEDGEVPVA